MKNKYENRPCYVVMFVSRNKDNKDIEDFEQRTKAFFTQKSTDELLSDFSYFVNGGVKGELSRFYISVNERKQDVIRISLQHYLIDHPEVCLANMDRLIASLAMKKGTALTKRFLFDYDEDKTKIQEFIEDVRSYSERDVKIDSVETPNGYAVIVERGFDTRELLKKWKNVELKRDGMLFVGSAMKKGI